jgi:hypothetical protein
MDVGYAFSWIHNFRCFTISRLLLYRTWNAAFPGMLRSSSRARKVVLNFAKDFSSLGLAAPTSERAHAGASIL